MLARLIPGTVIVTLLVLSGAEARQGKDKYWLGALNTDTSSNPPDQWFEQRLDHFQPTDNRTWQQRYFTSLDYYQEGGPAFILIQGEGLASSSWLVEGNWVNYAKQYNAAMFSLEHRFYGHSHPTSDLSLDNLKYLSTEQALADLATFITGMSTKYNLTSDNKWIAFGGSYSGNLAAWMRLKYPHLIHGAMSASGPVLAKVDFPEFMDVVRNSLATYGDNCVSAIQQADKKMNKLLKTKAGKATITELFKLCDPIDTSNKFDIYNLFLTLSNSLVDVVQYNKDNRFSSPTNITIDTVCDIMTNTSIGDPVQRYATFNSLMMDHYGETCVDFKYDSYVTQMQNTSWGGPESTGVDGDRQWVYQTCTEFGYYSTSENKKALFGTDFPLKFFLQQCSDIYGESFTPELVQYGVDRTNMLYGALELQVTRVVFVHGTIDPWHALGITSTRIEASPAILINGTAHCANMYPPRDSDVLDLTEARKTVGELIGQWLQEE